MAAMKAMEQAVMEQAVLQVAQQLEEKMDRELHDMDNMGEEDLERVRQARMVEMRRMASKKEQWMQKGHGEYAELQNEKEFFASMKGEERMVCHFYRENFPCKVMDKHLQILSKRHIETKFCKINAEKSPYLTDKLKIWMLPTLALVQSEKTVGYVVGFDDLGGVEDFKTETLALRLTQDSMIFYQGDKIDKSVGKQSGIRKSDLLQNNQDEDSDFD